MLKSIPAAAGILILSVVQSFAGEARYVTAHTAEERLCPNVSCPSTNKIYRQQKVEIFEVKNGWARVSKYYDGAVEGMPGEVARWVLAKHLALQRPADLPEPEFSKEENDPRISYLPKVGDNDLTAQDVALLRRYAVKLLKSGECTEIDDGDKSGSKPGTYYVHCKGETQNRFFKSGDAQ